MRFRLWLTAGLTLFALAAAVIGVIWIRERPDAVEQSAPWVEILELSGPTELAAGTTFTVGVRGDDDANGRALVLLRSGMHTFTREVTIRQGSGAIVLDGSVAEHAGVLTASTVHSAHQVVTHHIKILPGTTAQPVVPLIGPRTVRADGIEETMAVTLPADVFGNVAAEGTVVDLVVTRNAGAESVVQLDSAVDNLIAWSWIGSTTKTGVASVAATSQGVTGRVIEFEEVPLPPVVIPLLPPETIVIGDGRTLHEIRSLPLTDQFGNEVQDGIATTFFMKDRVGVRHLPGLVIDGTARVTLEAPSKPGVIEVWAVIQGVRSPVLAVNVERAVTEIPFEVAEVDGVKTISVGPVELATGGLVPDGTAVEVTGRDLEAEVLLESGRAMIEVEGNQGDVELAVLDTRVVVGDLR